MRLHKSEPPGWRLTKAALEHPSIKGFLVPSYQSDNEYNLVILHWKADEVKLHDPNGRMKAVYGSK
jgi:RES domain-containing protein